MIQLYDLLGNVVMQVNSPKDRQFAELNLSGHRKGIYIIKVTGEDVSEIRKLIYQYRINIRCLKYKKNGINKISWQMKIFLFLKNITIKKSV
jgi:hypothetical protein